jgi:lipoprotein-releasing system ATP-binding protein
MNSEPLYTLEGVGKEFAGPTERVRVLERVDLAVTPGETIAVLGASGSGKTTLLHILGTLDTATSGRIAFCGRALDSLGERQRARLRNEEIGFVFQFHHLLPEFSTVENVAMPCLIAGRGRAEAQALAEEALGWVGLADRLHQAVTTLSGGERQRAAIARAIVLKPRVVLADEPTGNLDAKTGKRIGDLMASLNRELGMTFIVVTHNRELAGLMGRRLELRAGELYALQ